MIDYNDIQFSYDSYLAEKELLENLLALEIMERDEGIGVYFEADQNGNKKSRGISGIQKYLEKVTASMQKAWDKWKQKTATQDNVKFLKDTSESIRGYKGAFIINNCPMFNIDNFTNIKVVPLDYQRMAEDLKKGKKKDFMSKYYPKLTGEQTIYNKFKGLIINSYDRVECDKAFLTTSFNFCSNDFYRAKRTIEADIETVNKSMEDIQKMLNDIGNSPEQVAVQNVKNECAALLEEYLTETPIPPTANNRMNNPNAQNNNKQQSTRMSFQDADGTVTKATNKLRDNTNSIAVHISRYMGVSAKIITAKMRVLRELYTNRYTIINHFSELVKNKPELVDSEKGREPKIQNNKVKI